MSIESVMPSSHLTLCHPSLLLPSIFPSIRVFSNESALHIMWPKYWSFSFSISPSNEYSGLISLVQVWELWPKGKSSLWEDLRPFNKQRKPLLVCDKILDLLGGFFFFFYGAKLYPWGFFSSFFNSHWRLLRNLCWEWQIQGHLRNSLEVEWLGFHTLSADSPGSISGWGTKFPQAMQYPNKIKWKEPKL